MSNEQAKKAKPVVPKTAKELVAVILIRGIVNVRKDIHDTLVMLRLIRKNCCIVIEATPANIGMLKKAKDYITWGPIDDITLKYLLEKKAEKSPKDPKKTKPFFRLNSPIKGYGRKGVKLPFTLGGGLGDRGEKINDLIKRMH